MLKVICVAVCALALAGTAGASLIGNGPPDQSGGSDLNAFLEGDSFVVGSSVNVTQIAFWSDQVDQTDYAGSTYWGIYSDASGVPGSPLFSGNPVLTGTATGNTTLGLNEFSYQFVVSFTLSPGTYWLVLHNGPTNTIPSTNFYWAWESGVSGNSQSQDLSVPSPWVANDAALAFQLTSDLTAVPEPASMCMVGSGLLAAWLARRKLSARS